MNKKEFLSKEQCEALSEINYDGDYDFVYHATGELWERGKKDKKERFLPAPLKQQVFRWFREKYNMLANVYSNASGFQYEYHDTIGGTHRLSSGYNGDCELSGAFTTYEKAEDGVINKLIELAKQQEK